MSTEENGVRMLLDEGRNLCPVIGLGSVVYSLAYGCILYRGIREGGRGEEWIQIKRGVKIK